ncbi:MULTISPECIES: HAMP domain-containing methyl-accepting chemotaxis protein [unclassified Clostridium]|uniref:methyl-accepting chemotaxis protein n=1 Tax=unclassified Clostridium TaxID=2614128 RepID=UPI000297620A|nr:MULTISPECIES: HAMP domain-containing methyl-accepting chemotaxis protein [unclassified Clostridium]EKQ51828.1 MAG: methyl-accepting chemotaxis protein [Clostridium sp. Maddingley MBC34-26]
MFNSIRKRLIFNFVLIAAIIILICISFFSYQMVSGIQNQMKADGMTLVNNIRVNIENAGVRNTDKIQGIIDQTYKYSDGELCYIGVISRDKTLLAGTSKESIGEKIESAGLDAVFKGNIGTYMYEWKGTPAYNVTVPIKDGDTIGYALSIGISVDNMQKSIRNTIIQSIIYAIVLLLLAAVAGVCIGKRIARPIEIIKDVIEKAGDGDFTAEYTITGKDEIGKLAAASSKTRKGMKELVRKIKVVSESLSNLSKNIEIGGSTVASSSEEIAASVTSVSQEGIKQTEALEEAVSLLGSFSEDLDNVDDKLALLADGGKIIKEDTNRGVETINKLANTIDEMLNSFSVSRSKVENLDKTISQINSIVDVINGVAKQTNLLALNASIEAARAGDAGKGFSVVAEEIRKLAEEVLNSSKSITQLINTVMKETHDVSNTTELVTKIVEESKNDINSVTTSFKGVISKVNNIPSDINKVHVVLHETMKGRDKILDTVENIASKSQEISALSQEVTASTEEQAAITNELFITAKKLVNISSVLEKDVSNFKI